MKVATSSGCLRERVQLPGGSVQVYSFGLQKELAFSLSPTTQGWRGTLFSPLPPFGNGGAVELRRQPIVSLNRVPHSRCTKHHPQTGSFFRAYQA
jgi:hypothetical protein